jgi:DNA/RNA endonuclease YhcR with UshA esterase domain
MPNFAAVNHKKNAMKKLFMLVLSIWVFGASTAYSQTTIHCWDFNGPSPDFTISPINPAAHRVTGNGTITHNITDVGAFAGNIGNACAGSAAGGSFCPRGGVNNENNGAFMTLNFPSTGFENLILSFYAQRTAFGFDSVALSYATSPTGTFTHFTNYQASSQVETFSLATLPGVNDNPDLRIRLTFFGATNATGNNRIDNLKLEGTPASTGLTNPAPFDLSTGNYTFNSWASTATAGTYPAHMAFWYTQDPSASWFNIAEPGSEDYNCGYDLTARPRFNGLGANGVSVITTGSPQRNDCIGGAADTTRYTGNIVLNLNTTGRTNIQVSWFNEIMNAPGRDFIFRLQYRLNNTGNFIDVPGPVEYNTTGKLLGDTATISTVLPAVLENQSNVQLRWAYFQTGTGSGTRPEIRFDELTVTSDAGTAPPVVYNISDINGVNAQGVADSLGVICTITGLVSGNNLRTSGVEFWMISPNNDAGLLVRSISLSTYTVNEGDLLQVEGTVDQFRGLIQFVPTAITVVSSNNTLPNPAEVFQLNEGTEGRLITLKNLQIAAGSSWPATGAANVLVHNATDTFTLRINAATNVASATPPTQPFDVVGHGGQFNPTTTPPFLSGYQIQPRYSQDVFPSGQPAGVTPISALKGVNAQGVADSLNVNTTITGYVSGGNLRTSGVEFWFISPNNDAGLLVRSLNYSGYTVTEGDQLLIEGTVTQFRGLIQFVPDTIIVVSSGNILPAPANITTLDESTEGRLVRFPFLTLVSGWTPGGTGFNAIVSDGTNTFTVRVVSATSMFNLPAPTTPFSLVGHGSQFAPSTTAPFVGGYQLQPRYASDLTPIIPAQPTVNFIRGTVSHLESAGTVPVTMTITPATTAAETLYISVAEDANVQPGDYSTTPAAVGGVITLPVPLGTDTLTFSMTIVNNTIQNPNKNITFTIDSVAGSTVVGPLNSKVVTIVDNDIPIPTYTISQVTGIDAQGVADSLGVMCRLHGIVLGVDMSGVSSPALQFTIHDGVRGIGVFASAVRALPYVVQEGDSVRLIGRIAQFRGLTQMEPDSIVLLSTGNALPVSPVVVTALGESTESELIRINQVTIVDPSQWTGLGSGFNVDVTDGTNTYVMRIDNDVDLFSLPIPTGVFDVVGIGGQFNPTVQPPLLSGYQILPRYQADIIFPTLAELAVTEIMPGSNAAVGSVRGDWFEILNYGATPVSLDGYSWSHDVEIPGRTAFPSGITIAPGEAIVVLDAPVADTAQFKLEWRIAGRPVQIITRDVMTGPFPNIKQSGDRVLLYDQNNAVLCRSIFSNAPAGRSAEFSNDCLFIGFASDGMRGAYVSNRGDIGSPGNVMPDVSLADFSSSFNLFPNPTRTHVTISFEQSASRGIELVNMLGVVVRSAESRDAAFTMSVGDLPVGMYFVRVTEGGQHGIRRLIVQ